MGFNPNITVYSYLTIFQVYAPTSSQEEDDIETFYETVQSVTDQKPSGDSLYIIGNFNAKVGKDISNGITGKFGLGERNERGDQLVEFCSRNDLQIMNTFFKQHPRRLYTWRSSEKITRNQIDYILYKTRWKSSIKRVTTLPGDDCGTNHTLLIVDIKIKQTNTTIKANSSQIQYSKLKKSDLTTMQR